MPAKSKMQQKAARAVLSAKRGEMPESKLVGRITRNVQLDDREGA
jgi:hypothetical protein